MTRRRQQSPVCNADMVAEQCGKARCKLTRDQELKIMAGDRKNIDPYNPAGAGEVNASMTIISVHGPRFLFWKCQLRRYNHDCH
jgi:hypothetical protein